MSGWAIVMAAVVATAPVSPQQRGVEAAMAESAAGWNAGDIDRFLAVYSDDPRTSFVTKDGVLRGKPAMRARYLARYPFADAEKRGTLTFTTLDFRLLDPRHALFIARYTLTARDGTTQSGPTSLVFRHEAGGWKIIADHSS